MAVKKKQQAAAGGAPEWMVTYGDMVTLLLTFFVLLLTFTEPKEKDLVQQLLEALRVEFGYEGGSRTMPTDAIDVIRNVPTAEILAVPIHPEDLSPTDDEGPRGRRRKVTNIRQTEYYMRGGKILFSELSADLTDAQRKQLAEYAESLRGHTFMIEVRGHTSKRPVEGTTFRDHTNLSYARARAVAQVLIDNGIDPRRIQVMAAGTARPVSTSAYSVDEREKNDLVEILQLNQSMSEFPQP